MGRVVEAVTQMRDEMKGMRVGQGEMGRLVKGMGKGALDVETKLPGLGSTVRAIQRKLAGRARAERHLAEMVSGLQRAGAVMSQAEETEENKQQLSPPGSGGKQQGAGGGWEGKGELERKQLVFKDEEQESAVQEEVEQRYGETGEALGVYEEMRVEVAGQKQQRPPRHKPLYGDIMERTLRRLRELKEEIAEREGKMRVRDDGREMREEVQPFGCASTAC